MVGQNIQNSRYSAKMKRRKERRLNKLLNVKTRQKYLKSLGFYKGKIDGVEGEKTKSAYLAIQKKYFTRKQDIDGVYGRDTDILLLNAIRVKNRTKNFRLEEFKCDCNGRYCTGYPAYLQNNLLKNIQNVRNKYKKPITVTSGLRCKGYNSELGGSISNSKHMTGRALDFYIPGQTTTESGRLSVMGYWKSLPNSTFAYCYLPTKYRTELERTASYMGTTGGAVHGDVK